MKTTIRNTVGRLALLSALILTLQPLTTRAQGTAFTYQGRLDSGGAPYTGLAEMQFSLWNAASGGSQLGSTLTVTPVSLTNGLFTVTLDFGSGVFTGPTRWLEIAVRTNFLGFTTLAPRQPITATPYAVLAGNVSGVIANSSLPSDPAFAGTVSAGGFSGNGGGLTNLNAGQLSGTVPAAALSNAWKIGGNAGTTPGTHFLGTTDNKALEFKVNGERALRLEPTLNGPNIIGGSANIVSGGGGLHVIAGGDGNAIVGPYGDSVIGGGVGNLIGITPSGGTIAFGGANVIGGGLANNIQSNANFSAIAGGQLNSILTNAGWAAVGGGYNNDIGVGAQYATIPGGRDNDANGNYSFAAGRRAKAINDGAFVWADSTDADFASTGNNQFLIRASGGVGIGTTAPEEPLHVEDSSSSGLTYPLKLSNKFPGTQGTTVGILFQSDDGPNRGKGALVYERTATWNRGSFHFLQNSAADPTMATNSHAVMTILNDGKVGIGTTGPTNKLHVAGGVSATAFVTTSDRNAKENFAPVSPCEVLAKVAALPISTWTFKEMPGARHMGPTAQDFHAAFGLGGSDTTITTVDPDGVALAAIQGLNQKLERENAALKARLERLEQLLESQLNGGAK